ncbi:hypothetical protein [Bacteroides heparinolyticus]|uniref:hypothetical protein n=1 Tax=Prevotella heparinolytica TaxID=28113 RepID=UPI0035A041B8
MSKKNTAKREAEEEEVMTDRMKVAEETQPMPEETGPLAEKASSLVEEDGDFQAAASPATAAEVSEACAATPDELAVDCLPARSRQAVRKEAKGEITSSPLESYHTDLPSRAREKKRIEKKRIENTSSI